MRKHPLFPSFIAIAIAGVCALGLSAPSGAGTSERIVTDFYTGLAIGGFDPVAYFTDRAAVEGVDAFEFREGGTIWRFRNEGNRAAFAAHPEIYGPQFGGYDPVEMADYRTVAGYPAIWMVAGDRLFLFASEESRTRFRASRAVILRNAKRAWHEIRRTLPR